MGIWTILYLVPRGWIRIFCWLRTRTRLRTVAGLTIRKRTRRRRRFWWGGTFLSTMKRSMGIMIRLRLIPCSCRRARSVRWFQPGRWVRRLLLRSTHPLIVGQLTNGVMKCRPTLRAFPMEKWALFSKVFLGWLNWVSLDSWFIPPGSKILYPNYFDFDNLVKIW